MIRIFNLPKIFFTWTFLILSIIYIIGCTDTDTIVKDVTDGGTEIGNPENETIVAGYAQKGPFQKFSTVFMYELDDNLEQTGRSFHELTDEVGHFSIPASLESDYVELAINGYYFDEISYDPDDPNYLYSGDVQTSAIAAVSDNNEININILTSIAKETILALIDDGMTFDEANAQASVYVLDAFGITDDTHTLFEDMAMLEEPGTVSQEGNKILLAVSAIMMQMAHDADEVTGDSVAASLNEIRNIIIDDIANNYVLDNIDIQNAMDAAVMSLDHVNIRSHMEDSFPDHNIPRFEEYILGDLNIRWTDFNCATNSISFIEADIYDPETGHITAGPWPCNELEGTVIGLNAGNYDLVTIYFMNQYNEIVYSAEKTDVQVIARQTNILNVSHVDYISGGVSVQSNIDCTHSTINTINAAVFDSVGNEVQTAGPWDCDDDKRMIGEIADMTGGRVELYYNDLNGDLLYQVDITDISVTPGTTTDLGQIIIDPPSITAPLKGSTYIEGNTISFNGTGFDLLGNPLNGTSLVWSSNIDGNIGTGEIFSLSSLSYGLHTITLTAVDSAFRSINTSINLHIRAPGVTIYVGPGEAYATIQSAVTGGNSGDRIIVRDGTYTESVTVNKELTIQSENGYSSTIVNTTDPNRHVFIITADYVKIEGFTIYGATNAFRYGIYLNGASSCTFSNNRCGYDAIHNNYGGMYIRDSLNCSVTNNICDYNLHYGISVRYAGNHNIVSNICTSNGYCGIGMTLTNNNIVSNNTLNSNTTSGIRLSEADTNTISDNTCNSNQNGIYAISSYNNIISKNICGDNETGIMFSASSDNIVFDNTFNQNSYNGIGLYSSLNNNISGNTCLDNTFGIQIYTNSNNNIISGNTFGLNSNYGMNITSSSNNIIYLNNFDNSNNINSTSPSVNTWRSPTEITYTYNGSEYTRYLGNYYNDHVLTDSNGDGITDDPYDLPGDEPDDEYPLVDTLDNYN